MFNNFFGDNLLTHAKRKLECVSVISIFKHILGYLRNTDDIAVVCRIFVCMDLCLNPHKTKINESNFSKQSLLEREIALLCSALRCIKM
jgi:hypothetical protein